jgi:predicted acylesterase/phospholipase RssA/CRP-like cAMP-binding protein
MPVIDVSGVALDLSTLDELASARSSLKMGDVLVEEGGEADTVYVVLGGDLEIRAGGNSHLIATAGRGSLVGETAVLAGGVRTATVTSLGEASVLHFDRTAFGGLLDRYPELARRVAEEAVSRLDRRHLLDFLHRILGRLDGEVLDDVERRLHWFRVPAGTELFHQGDPATSGYFVISGRFRLVHEDGYGNVESVGDITRDGMLGESGLIGMGAREVSALAVRDSLVVRVESDDFFELVKRQPGVLLPVVTTLAGRSRVVRRSRRERTLALLVAGDVDRRLFSTRLVGAMSEHGEVGHIWSARADGLLGREGASQVVAGEPGDVRVAQLLHELEMEHTYLVCETDPQSSGWTHRVARQADRLVAILPSRPTDREIQQVVDLFAQAILDTERLLVVNHRPEEARPISTRQLCEQVGATDVVHIREGSPGDFARLARILAGTAYGLVLGGGGARGFAHLGVYRAMGELGIPVDLVGGSSIGAPLAAGIAIGLQDPQLTATVEQRFSDVLDYTLPVVSLVKGERIASSIESILGGWDFEDTWLSYFCISTNITQGSQIVHRSGPLTPAVRASVAIPGVIPPVPWGEDLLVDGGVLNNLPTDVIRHRNPTGTVIAVDVAPTIGPRARSDIGLSVSGWKALRSRFSRNGQQYPGITAVLLRTQIVGSVQGRRASLDRGDADLLLDLDLRGVSLLEFDAVRSVADAGYEAAMPRLESWLAEREQG